MKNNELVAERVLDVARSTGLVGIDAFSATSPLGDERVLGAVMAQFRTSMEKRGGIKQAWTGLGFTGVRYGALRYGVSRTSELLMISGNMSGPVAAETPSLVKCTRMDIAVTAVMGQVFPGFVQKLAQWAEYHHQRDGSPRAWKFITSNNGGATLYLGARKSQKMLRIYDKGAEMGDKPGQVFRWELELKGGAAEWFHGQWQCERDPSRFALSVISGQMKKYAHLGWSATGIDERKIVSAQLIAHDDELEVRKAWLHETVRPALQKLRPYCTIQDIVGYLGIQAEGGLEWQ